MRRCRPHFESIHNLPRHPFYLHARWFVAIRSHLPGALRLGRGICVNILVVDIDPLETGGVDEQVRVMAILGTRSRVEIHVLDPASDRIDEGVVVVFPSRSDVLSIWSAFEHLVVPTLFQEAPIVASSQFEVC
jgi:hypothetical protein